MKKLKLSKINFFVRPNSWKMVGHGMEPSKSDSRVGHVHQIKA